MSRLAPLLPLLLAAALGCAREPRRGMDRVVVGLEGEPQQLDPRFGADAYSSRVATLLYSGLLRTGPDGAVRPDLAERMETPSPTHYRFVLRPGLRFHDGSPCEAEDAAATLRSLRDPALGSPKSGTFGRIARIETPSPLEIDIFLSEPYAPLAASLTQGIVPRAWAGRGPGAEPPPGTGPYRLARWERGSRLLLERWEGYHGGPARLPRAELRLAADPATALLRLKAGELDLLQNSVSPDHLKALAKMKDLRVILQDGVGYSYLGFNLEDPILSDPRVRRAIAHAVDREAIVRHLLRGTATPATGLLAPGNWAYSADVPAYAYDPERARALLDEAGRPAPPGGGPRFEIGYKTSTNPLRRQIAEVIQHQLEEVGVGVRVQSLEFGTFFGQIQQGNFQMFSLTWVGIQEPDIYYEVFHSSQTPPGGANRGRYRSAEMDRLVAAARAEPDAEARRRLYAEVQRLAAEDLPYASLWWSKDVVVARADLRGFAIYPGGDFYPLKDAWYEGAP